MAFDSEPGAYRLSNDSISDLTSFGKSNLTIRCPACRFYLDKHDHNVDKWET